MSGRVVTGLWLLLAAPAPTEPFDAAKAQIASRIADPEAATRAYVESVPAERRARTKAYARGDYMLDVLESITRGAALVWLLASGSAAGLRERLRRRIGRRPLLAAACWCASLAVATLAVAPVDVYRSYWRERAYGLLTQGFGAWLGDQAKYVGVTAVFGALLVAVLYGVIAKAPRTWWLWAAAVVIAFQAFSAAVVPVFVAPLFYRFSPVQDQAVRTDILAMARAHGVPADDVYQIDASRRTDRISAAVVGLFGTTRIVVFDNTLRRCTPPEIRMVLGHEMGHYVRHHVAKGLAVSAALVLAGFLFVRWAFPRAMLRWPGMRVEGVADPAGLPLLWLLLGVFVFVSSPLRYAWLRTLESQADVFGLEASREPDAAATVFLKLGEYRDLDPHPVVEALFFSHPSGRSRIRQAMEWKRRNAVRLAGSPCGSSGPSRAASGRKRSSPAAATTT
jgi:STE24 endopeptidase